MVLFKDNGVSGPISFNFNNNNFGGGSGGGPGGLSSGSYSLPFKPLVLVPAVDYDSSSYCCIVLESEVFDILGKILRDYNNVYSI